MAIYPVAEVASVLPGVLPAPYRTAIRQFNDRGTKDFEIWAADKVDAERQRVDPRLVVRGALPCRYGTGSETPFDAFSAAKQDFA
jgi:hypothetical protein